MATKDWKKTIDTQNYIEWMNKNRIYVGVINSNGLWKNPHKGWSFTILNRNSIKNFKTKTSAMKFARSYMKKH